MARARQRSSVIITTRPWPGTHAAIEVTDRRFQGLGRGRGRLRRSRLPS